MAESQYLGSNLIFLISLPHAGTAMLGQWFNGQRNLYCPLEPCAMLGPVHALKRPVAVAAYESPLARMAHDRFVGQLPGREDDYLDALRAMASVLYGRALSAAGKTIFVDSSTPNYLIVPELRTVFPEAKFVFLLRNPLAVFLSALSDEFANDVRAFEQSARYRDILRSVQCVGKAVFVPGHDQIRVCLEELITDPGNTLSNLSRRLGIACEATDAIPRQARFMRIDRGVSELLSKAKDPQETSALRTFAENLLHGLAEELVQNLGYDYAALLECANGLSSAPARSSTAEVMRLNEAGEQLFGEGKVEAAMDRFVRAHAIDAHNADTLNNMAVVCWHQGHEADALVYLAGGLQADPGNRALVINAVRILQASNRFVEGLGVCRAYLRNEGQDDELLQLVEQLEIDAADTAAGISAAASGTSRPAYGHVLDALNRLGEDRFISGDPAGARRILAAVVAFDSENSDVLNRLAVEGCSPAEPAGTPDCAGDISAKVSGDSDAVSLTSATVAGYVAFQPPDTQAQDLLRRSTASRTVMGLNETGEACFAVHDLEGARRSFLEAYALAPGDGTTCNNLGVLFWHTGDQTEALDYTGRAAEAAPDNETFVTNAVKLRIETGQVQDALNLCASYLEPVVPRVPVGAECAIE